MGPNCPESLASSDSAKRYPHQRLRYYAWMETTVPMDNKSKAGMKRKTPHDRENILHYKMKE